MISSLEHKLNELRVVKDDHPSVEEQPQVEELEEKPEASEIEGKELAVDDKLRIEGVEYSIMNTVKRLYAKSLGEVAPNGDCQYLALRQVAMHQMDIFISSRDIRSQAVNLFLDHYQLSDEDVKYAIDTKIRHMYFPSGEPNWEITPIVTLYYLVSFDDEEELDFKISELIKIGMDEHEAKEMIYEEAGIPVVNARVYSVYMGTGGTPWDSHYIVAMHYTECGLLSVDDHANTVAWGDDIILEAVATVFERNVVVLLLHEGEPLVLTHEPYYECSEAKTEVPMVLSMRSHGDHNGGDHYSPLLASLTP